MNPKVEGTPEVASAAKKAHVWGPDVASGGILNLLPPGGVSLDHICRLCEPVTSGAFSAFYSSEFTVSGAQTMSEC